MDPSQRLVQRAQDGDASAFGELISLHERAALSVAYAATGDAASAGDVTQDAFLRAWERLSDLRDTSRFGPWLCRIVRNLATDAARRRPPTATVPLDEGAAATATGDPGDRWARGELRCDVERALATLDELTRSAVVLRYFDGMPSRAIAERLDLTPAAVDMRLSRARTLLREQLAAHAGNEP